jgi:hypothetical protein
MQRITRGEAEAVLHARGTGGFHGRGPSDANQQVAIRPFYANGLHYCVEDWHVLALGLILDEQHDGVPNLGEAKKLLDPVVMTFELDGGSLDTTRQPVKAFLGESPKGFVLAQGRVVAPGELAVGSHTLTVTVENDPLGPPVQVLTSQFFIDAAGTGTCI